jgi:surfactin synthase thioesterase subunit
VSSAREKFQERGFAGIPDPESLSSFTLEKRDEILEVIDSMLRTNAEYQSTLNASLELLRLQLPTALAELQMVGNYERGDTLLFDVPITAIYGEMDDKVTASEMRAWQELTHGPFTFHTLPGGHLFLHEDQCQERLLELIARDLEKYR